METVNINLVFFGSLKRYFGCYSLMILPKGTNLGLLLKMLKDKVPDASEILDCCRIAVDLKLEASDFSILHSSEIVLLPPFSGG